MNALVRKYLGSLIRSGLIALAAVLIQRGWWTQDQADALVSPLTEALVGVAIGLGTLLWSLVQKHAQETLFHTALAASPRTPPEDVVGLVKRGFGKAVSLGGKVLPIVLLALLLPALASAQSIRASIAPAVHDVAVAHAQDPGNAADAIVTDTALAAAEWIFISSQAFHVSYAAIQEHQSAEAVTQTVIVGVTSTAGTLALAKLLPARWQRFAALVGVGVTTAIIDGRKIVADIHAAQKK